MTLATLIRDFPAATAGVTVTVGSLLTHALGWW